MNHRLEEKMISGGENEIVYLCPNTFCDDIIFYHDRYCPRCKRDLARKISIFKKISHFLFWGDKSIYKLYRYNFPHDEFKNLILKTIK